MAINAVDETPSREAQALLQLQQNRPKPDENIYLAVAGFNAPPGQPVVTAGLARIDRYNGQVDAMFRDPLLGMKELTETDPAALQFKGALDFGPPRGRPFWSAVRANGPKIHQLLDQNRELYERYRALHEMPLYFETARASVMEPIVMVPTEVRNLFLAEVSSRMQTGADTQTQSALGDLRDDINFWRRVFTGEGGLISKLIAVACLQNDYLILSDMIADPSTSVPQNINEFMPTSDLKDWDIGGAFANEFRVHSFIHRQAKALSASDWQPPDSAGSALGIWFNRNVWNPIGEQIFKLNATENLSAKDMNELAAFAAMNPANFVAQRNRYKAWESENTDFMKPSSVYNPIGKILVAISVAANQDFLLRPYDAAALERLVRLSLEIRRQQVEFSGVPAFMKLHPEWSTHPADGRAFVWNPKTGEIAIVPIAKQQADRRFSVQIWHKNPES